jgi:ribosomal protein S8
MVEMNEDGVRAMYAEIAKKIENEDARLRRRLVGQPVDKVKPHVAEAMSRIGFVLTAEQFEDYSKAISQGVPYHFKLI